MDLHPTRKLSLLDPYPRQSTMPDSASATSPDSPRLPLPLLFGCCCPLPLLPLRSCVVDWITNGKMSARGSRPPKNSQIMCTTSATSTARRSNPRHHHRVMSDVPISRSSSLLLAPLQGGDSSLGTVRTVQSSEVPQRVSHNLCVAETLRGLSLDLRGTPSTWSELQSVRASTRSGGAMPPPADRVQGDSSSHGMPVPAAEAHAVQAAAVAQPKQQ